MAVKKPAFRDPRSIKFYKAYAVLMAAERRKKGKTTQKRRGSLARLSRLKTKTTWERYRSALRKLTYLRWSGQMDRKNKWDLSIKRFLAKKYRWPSSKDSHPTLQTRGDWLRIQRERAAEKGPVYTHLADFKTSALLAGGWIKPLSYNTAVSGLRNVVGEPTEPFYRPTSVPVIRKNTVREPSWMLIEDPIAEIRPNKKWPILRKYRIKNAATISNMSLLRHHPIEWLTFYRRWKAMWRTYSRILRRSGLYSRRVWIERGKVRVAWDHIGVPDLPPATPAWRLLRAVPRNGWRQHYFKHLWNAILRLKFERFFFKNSGVRTYLWLHNIWKFTKKRLSKWPRFERKSMWRLTNFRNRFSLRRGLARLFLRTLGLFFSVPGTAHCFVHILTYLIRRFRRHWQLLKFVDGYLKLGRKVFLRHATVGYRVMISGKFTGKMRARKHIFGTGKIKFLMWEWPIDYTRADSFTRWGVFGISVWVQTRLKHRASRKFMGYTRKPVESNDLEQAFAPELSKNGSAIIRRYRKKKQRLEQKRLKALEPPKE